MIRRRKLLICLAVLALSMCVRFALIRITPKYDNSIDLEIYRAGGSLVAQGVNPYDHSDGLVEREALRSRTTQVTLKDPKRWDDYASSNLPATLLLFGAIASFHDSALAYRYTFAGLDCVLSLGVFLFVLHHWPSGLSANRRSPSVFGSALAWNKRLLIAISLGALSPTLLKWGTIFPEDKGVQTLLMICTLACILSDRWRRVAYMGAVALGLSIAYKGLGIFLLPLFIVRLFSYKARSLWQIILSFSLCAVTTCVWFLPFGASRVFQMGKGRLLINSAGLPQHASMWVWLARELPDYWNALRIGFVVALLCATYIGYARRRFGLEVVTAVALMAFVVVWLTGGSMDRVNIGMLTSMLLLGRYSVKAALPVVLVYLLVGTVGVFSRGEGVESAGALFWSIVFASTVAWQALGRRPDVLKSA
jgi:hypothetical protein